MTTKKVKYSDAISEIEERLKTKNVMSTIWRKK